MSFYSTFKAIFGGVQYYYFPEELFEETNNFDREVFGNINENQVKYVLFNYTVLTVGPNTRLRFHLAMAVDFIAGCFGGNFPPSNEFPK